MEIDGIFHNRGWVSNQCVEQRSYCKRKLKCTPKAVILSIVNTCQLGCTDSGEWCRWLLTQKFHTLTRLREKKQSEVTISVPIAPPMVNIWLSPLSKKSVFSKRLLLLNLRSKARIRKIFFWNWRFDSFGKIA